MLLQRVARIVSNVFSDQPLILAFNFLSAADEGEKVGPNEVNERSIFQIKDKGNPTLRHSSHVRSQPRLFGS